MPIFEFECPSCTRRVERILARAEQADVAVIPCPFCLGDDNTIARSSTMKRVPTAGSFVLKGSGFHCVDYKGKK